MSRAYLLYGFWLPCGPDDPIPPGVDQRIWTNQSPARALEVAIAARSPFHSFQFVDAWNGHTLDRVYFGQKPGIHTGPEFLDELPIDPSTGSSTLIWFYGYFGGREYGWHLFSADQEDP